jgi:hypothetical protein
MANYFKTWYISELFYARNFPKTKGVLFLKSFNKNAVYHILTY